MTPEHTVPLGMCLVAGLDRDEVPAEVPCASPLYGDGTLVALAWGELLHTVCLYVSTESGRLPKAHNAVRGLRFLVFSTRYLPIAQAGVVYRLGGRRALAAAWRELGVPRSIQVWWPRPRVTVRA